MAHVTRSELVWLGTLSFKLLPVFFLLRNYEVPSGSIVANTRYVHTGSCLTCWQTQMIRTNQNSSSLAHRSGDGYEHSKLPKISKQSESLVLNFTSQTTPTVLRSCAVHEGDSPKGMASFFWVSPIPGPETVPERLSCGHPAIVEVPRSKKAKKPTVPGRERLTS